MSEAAAEAGAGPGMGQAGVPGTGASGSSAEDSEAEGLLGGMLDGGQGDDEDDMAEQLAHWKTMARKNEQRARQNASAAARLAEIENANKTDLQKALDAQTAAERERDEALQMHSRMMAAAANNLPVELIEHLGTGTEEEINERAELFARVIEETAQEIAEQLVADMGGSRNGDQQPPPQLGGTRPVESMRAGSAPSGATPQTNEQWFRNLLHNS